MRGIVSHNRAPFTINQRFVLKHKRNHLPFLNLTSESVTIGGIIAQ